MGFLMFLFNVPASDLTEQNKPVLQAKHLNTKKNTKIEGTGSYLLA